MAWYAFGNAVVGYIVGWYSSGHYVVMYCVLA